MSHHLKVILILITMIGVCISMAIVAYVTYKLVNEKKKKQLIHDCLKNRKWICAHEVAMLTGLKESEVAELLAKEHRLIEIDEKVFCETRIFQVKE